MLCDISQIIHEHAESSRVVVIKVLFRYHVLGGALFLLKEVDQEVFEFCHILLQSK